MFKTLFSKKPLQNRIEFCVSNAAYCDADVYDILDAREDVIVEDTGCNSHCEVCDCHFYALVNGEVVAADSALALLAKINQELEENSL